MKRSMGKAVSCFVIILLSMLFLGGCAEKLVPRDAEGVKRKLDLLKYYDEKYMVEKSSFGVYTLGGLMKNGWTFSYSDYGAVDEEVIESEYTLALLLIDVTVEHKDANYTISEGKSAMGNYALISRVDNRLMAVYGPEDQKEDIRTLAVDLGFYREEFGD